jgi:hypothetical protein
MPGTHQRASCAPHGIADKTARLACSPMPVGATARKASTHRCWAAGMVALAASRSSTLRHGKSGLSRAYGVLAKVQRAARPRALPPPDPAIYRPGSYGLVRDSGR